MVDRLKRVAKWSVREDTITESTKPDWRVLLEAGAGTLPMYAILAAITHYSWPPRPAIVAFVVAFGSYMTLPWAGAYLYLQEDP